MSSPAGERSRPRSSSVRSVSSKTSAAGRTSMGQCEQPAGFDRSSSEHGSLSKLQEGYRSPTGQSGTSSAERVFPVSSIVYPSSTQGGEILSPSSSVAAQRDFSGDPSLSPTARSRPQRQSSYFGSSVRLQEPATIPEKSSGSTNNSPSTSEHPSSHTIHTSQRASGPIAENSDTYVQGLHRSQHEVHAEPDADEIIRRARAARQKHDSAEQASETGSSIRSGAEPLLTVRFEHQETEDGHMIITGREGEIQRCEDEVSNKRQ